jgi:hypothetical protein
LVAAASLVAQPLFVPAAIRAIPGFTVAPGFWVGLGVVAVLIAAAPVFAVIAGRVRMLDPPTFDIGGRAPAPDRDPVESKGS